ncbi:MAG: HAD-IIIA family hydrolase [Candidatus Omnitrophota bacterium]|jgi:histidinol-phosphate phosphatase family protein
MNKAVFLDRDGTINEDIGDLYLPGKLIFISRAIEALKLLQENFLLFIITNQSGVGKGAFRRDEYIRFNDYFINTLKKHGVAIKEVFCCLHIKEEKRICRKPSPYFIEKAKKAYNLDIGNSYSIGDHPHDMEMAKKAGAHSVFLLAGHGTKHKKELSSQPDHIANDLYEAAL